MTHYYTVLSQSALPAAEAVFGVQLCSDSDVYRGHFPGQPIAPGVCNVEMIRELASLMAGRELRFAEIRQCKFVGLIRPEGQELTVRIALTDDRLTATVSSPDALCISLKAVVK